MDRNARAPDIPGGSWVKGWSQAQVGEAGEPRAHFRAHPRVECLHSLPQALTGPACSALSLGGFGAEPLAGSIRLSVCAAPR